jgi:hypothetical protein
VTGSFGHCAGLCLHSPCLAGKAETWHFSKTLLCLLATQLNDTGQAERPCGASGTWFLGTLQVDIPWPCLRPPPHTLRRPSLFLNAARAAERHSAYAVLHLPVCLRLRAPWRLFILFCAWLFNLGCLDISKRMKLLPRLRVA